MNENPKHKEFLERYKALVDEMQIDMAIYPQFIPDGKGGFQITCQSIPVNLSSKEQGTPSPFVLEK